MVRTDMGNGSLPREAIYDLRRLLIARLQMATRGKPRSRRVADLQGFARGWQELEATGQLNQLVMLVNQEDSEIQLPEIFLSLARITEPVRSGSEPEALPDLSRPSASPPLRVAGEGTNSWWVGNRQGDLFPTGLMTQPA